MPAEFCMFLAHIFWGKASDILDHDYKIENNSHHVSKFHGDQLTEHGDFARGKNN